MKLPNLGKMGIPSSNWKNCISKPTLLTFSTILRVLDEYLPQAQTLIMASKHRFLGHICYIFLFPHGKH